MWNSAAQSTSFREERDDEEALRWAALERLPTYTRVRLGIFKNILGDSKGIDVEKLQLQAHKIILDRLLNSVEEDWEKFFRRLRRRFERLTLLLGPPSSGKTTLLLALAGRLKSDLQMSGEITYNGHGLNEFVPQKTAAYVSQQDWHVAEMTVRETLDFPARCQGVGYKYDMLLELARREKIAGIKPDEDIDIFMKALALEGMETGLVVEYILKVFSGC
ncbi:unnamed protein product [Fraxinus pennsylvanica]|uniref:ABC transporter domain-containing protein n=1 Tax=Fraxinus pennsylvanica TaxID=56036 RepID=A0AAD2E9M7_9LAMI|nr:unnamed protein product [Fraxinus pennsylvanica]